MSNLELISVIGEQEYQVECALAVLREVQEYFECPAEWYDLPRQARTLDALLAVTASLLSDVTEKMKRAHGKYNAEQTLCRKAV